MNSKQLYEKVKRIKNWKITLISFHKPMIPSELKTNTGLTRDNYINFVLREFSKYALVKCYNPRARTGRVYGLTEQGKRLKRKLIKELTKEEKSEIHISYIEPSIVDLNLYGRIMAESSKMQYLKIAYKFFEIKKEFKAYDIFSDFREQGKSTPRTEVYRALKQFVSQRILIRVPEGRRGVKFKFTRKGLVIVKYLLS